MGYDIEQGNENKNPQDNKGFFPNGKKPNKFFVIGIAVMFVVVLITSMLSVSNTEKGTISYNEFMKELNNKNIEAVVYTGVPKTKVIFKEGVAQGDILDEETGELRELEIEDGKRIEYVINPYDDDFYKTVAQMDADVLIESNDAVGFLAALLGIAPTFLLIGVMIWFMKKQFGGGLGDKKVTATKSSTRFTDVAGMTEEKEELMFAIKSLQHTEEYVAKGVKPVKGILLEGPPGVGKTMLAKAVAGEAGVNFLSYSGADFVEMFVGLGARRIRTMYEEAEKQKPCVVFIDEIDALGKKRSGGGDAGLQEADQTLIALLERMDGMNTTSGILFIAATNRVDALDSALLRPGRFDKTIHVSPPKTKEDREAIVKVHSVDKTFEDGLTIEKVAKQCYGLTGAEIASALNDAVLESFKADRNGIISLDDVDKAIMKLYARGLAKGRHSDKDLYRVAIHEVGHALMNKELNRDVVKISIQPYSSGIGGVTVVDGETSGMEGLRTKTDLENDIKVLYAGKVAEEVMLEECSVGASNDLERATFVLRDYIGAYGMQNDSYLSLVGLAKENWMISANEKLLEDMKKTSIRIYEEVLEFFKKDEVKKNLQNVAQVLVEEEVIYDLEDVIYDLEDVLNGTHKKPEEKVEKVEEVEDISEKSEEVLEKVVEETTILEKVEEKSEEFVESAKEVNPISIENIPNDCEEIVSEQSENVVENQEHNGKKRKKNRKKRNR